MVMHDTNVGLLTSGQDWPHKLMGHFKLCIKQTESLTLTLNPYQVGPRWRGRCGGVQPGGWGGRGRPQTPVRRPPHSLHPAHTRPLAAMTHLPPSAPLLGRTQGAGHNNTTQVSGFTQIDWTFLMPLANKIIKTYFKHFNISMSYLISKSIHSNICDMGFFEKCFYKVKRMQKNTVKIWAKVLDN